VDKEAKKFAADMEAEELRLARLVGDFVQIEEMKAREAEKARLEGLSALEKERSAALQNAKDHDEVDAINQAFADRAAALPAAVEPPRAEGQSVRHDWEIEVVNPFDLARYHPNCVNITPRLIEIKQLLNEGVVVRGINAKKVVQSSVRVKKG
jgi:hypothetical protein